MITLEDLKNYGADTDEGMSRCFGNAEFYLKLVSVIPDEKNFDHLKEAVERGELGEAFEAAHALKGVLANLSLTPLLKPVSEITELLRAKEDADYEPYLEEIFKQKDALKAIM